MKQQIFNVYVVKNKKRIRISASMNKVLFKLLTIHLKPSNIKPIQFFQNAIDAEHYAFDPELPVSTQLTEIAILELVDKEIVEKFYAAE